VRQDRIDILVDLAGHTGGNRLVLFARKPAPIQATHFAYPDTTGLRTIDYRITDASSDPPGLTERYHTEKLLRLPEICWCYRPDVDLQVLPIPAREPGRVTFGSLNTLAKVTPEVIALWSRVLTALPEARIHVLTGVGSQGDCRVLELFARNGIRSERITLLAKRSRPDYFKLYQAIDICLDPFPYNGCNTSADALWMGVPLITLAGMTYVSRQGVSLLSHLGLQELIAKTPEDYVEIATRLAHDLDRLQALRSGLRERMLSSTLMNPLRFTRQLEQGYRQMWQTWCRSG
jgi:predicted O-linked N-acetylglucosamine transferase (SPINDLY family)